MTSELIPARSTSYVLVQLVTLGFCSSVSSEFAEEVYEGARFETHPMTAARDGMKCKCTMQFKN
jgi:hypothetical protein